ncbi:MAG: hypothetical protein R8G66_33840 [Cytophagales bacterium]|nr:hypothetical protein [Cytophagales bacterium]
MNNTTRTKIFILLMTLVGSGVMAQTYTAPLNVTSNNDAIATYMTTDNTWLFTQWLNSSGQRKAYMGLSSNLSEFRLNLENGTDEFNINGADVGIGTYTPQAKLDVRGSIYSTGDFTFGTNAEFSLRRTVGEIGQGADLIIENNQGSTNQRFKIIDGTSSTPPGFAFDVSFDAGSTWERDFVYRGNKLGIGTATPNALLDIAGNTAVYDDFIGYSGVTNGTQPNGKAPTLIIRENTAGTKSPNGATYKGGLSFGVGGAGIYSVNPNPHGSANYGDLRFHTTYYNGSGFSNADRMVITRSGVIGIGTVSPVGLLDIRGTGTMDSRYKPSKSYLRIGDGNISLLMDGNEIYSNHKLIFGSSYTKEISFRNVSSTAYEQLMVIKPNGKVGIGTNSPTQELSVDGKINAEEIILEDVSGADFVFEEDYDLRSLEETEQFIKVNKHLPEVPSAAEMAEEGLAIKDMNILLLQKVEELTLHLIRMEKEAIEMKQNTENLTSKVLQQEEKIRNLEAAQNN